MLNKPFRRLTYLLVSLFYVSGSLSAATEYEIQDIGTLQTYSSRPIALNNQSEILGVYNLDGSKDGELVFLRDKEGLFSELPATVDGVRVSWGHLTDKGVVYGVKLGPGVTLFMWDLKNGAVNLGPIPGEIAAVNNNGQILISYTFDYVDGERITHPVIWDNGEIIKLKGLEGDAGIPSDEAYGFDLNNHGDVVGQSTVYLIYKNDLYKQTHATKWVNGKAIDLHETVPKTDSTKATLINDRGEIIVGSYLLHENGKISRSIGQSDLRATSTNFFYRHDRVISYDCNNVVTDLSHIRNAMSEDRDSIWLTATQIIDVNDNGEIIALGKTIYGEEHALFLAPANRD